MLKEENTSDEGKGVSSITRQFMAGIPVNEIAWENPPGELKENEQVVLLQQTAFHPDCSKYPLCSSYQRRFFKKILRDIEDNGGSVCEGLYQLYVKILQDTDEAVTYKSYYIPHISTFIPILESKMLLSNGTTGLTTWPGALLLSEWCVANTEYFAGKNIIELGCGVGLVGIVVCKVCKPMWYVFTDYHDDVMSYLESNIQLNFGVKQKQLKENNIHNADNTNRKNENVERALCNDEKNGIKVMKLNWCDYHMKKESILHDEQNIDIILAADVVFDPSIVPDLVQTIAALLTKHRKKHKTAMALFSLTVRNPTTFELFLSECIQNNLEWTQLDSILPGIFYYDRSADIRLIKIVSQTSAS